MKTADQICLEHTGHRSSRAIEEAMIEFAKMHVQAALKAANEKAQAKVEFWGYGKEVQLDASECGTIINQDSILNSYPLDNIK